MRPRVPLSAHAWTIGPNLLARIAPPPSPPARAWSTELDDPRAGKVRLTGVLQAGDSNTCLVIVHGLGGSYDRAYCVRAAWAAHRLGLHCLRFALRGADRSGVDFYHGGLTADLAAALASPALAQFERLLVLGYSLGGHMTLRYAQGPTEPRVAAVAAVCAPLDLDLGAQSIDARASTIYRRHVLSGLNDIYAAVAAQRPVPTPLSRVLAARSIRQWDGLTVVPRYGFRDALDYYRECSAGPRLDAIRVPTLLVQNQHDPMVPPWTYADHLRRASKHVELQMLKQGGHVGFPRVRLHPQARPGVLEDQVIAWLMRHR